MATIDLGKHTTLPDDAIGDMPWLRLLGEVRARSAHAGRRTRRMARRWLHRQRTAQGHAAQVYRGTRQTAGWVRGFEGNHVRAAAQRAHIATKESHAAARQARWTVRGREDAKRLADRTNQAAEQAVAAHKKAKKDRSRARNTRAAVVLAAPTAGLCAGAAELGWLGVGSALLATMGGLAVVGRKPIEDVVFETGWRSLGDGDPMTATLLDQAFRAAGVIGKEETLRLVKPAMVDRGAWVVSFDLPQGITAKKAMGRVDEIAAALGVEAAQVTMEKAGRAGRVDMRVSDRLPFTDKPGRGPLLSTTGPTNLWGSVQIGPDVRGDQVQISLVERSGLIGGEPGAGKSASGNVILLAAALDPRVELRLADGKGGGDLEPFEPLCSAFEGDADPEALLAMLDDVIADMGARYALLKSLGKRKVTEGLADAHPQLRQMVLWIDELMFFTTDEEFGKKITKRLRNIVSRGRAAGIITFCATQKPGSDVVDTSLRDLLSIRWALRCNTPQASDTILGQGAAANGFSAKVIEMQMRGAGWLLAEGTDPVMVRADYYDDDQVAELVKRAFVYRQQAGTLPEAAKPSLRSCLTKAAESRGCITTAEALRIAADMDPTIFGRRDDDTDASYATRAGKALRVELGDTVTPSKVTGADGTRTNGYTLTALRDAR